MIKALLDPLPHLTSAQSYTCGLILNRQKLRPRKGNCQGHALNSGLFGCKSKIFPTEPAMEPQGTNPFPAKDSPLINPSSQRRTHGVRLKVSCFALGSPFPGLHSWPQGGETAPQFPRTGKQPQALDQFPELLTMHRPVLAYLLIFCRPSWPDSMLPAFQGKGL